MSAIVLGRAVKDLLQLGIRVVEEAMLGLAADIPLLLPEAALGYILALNSLAAGIQLPEALANIDRCRDPSLVRADIVLLAWIPVLAETLATADASVELSALKRRAEYPLQAKGKPPLATAEQHRARMRPTPV